MYAIRRVGLAGYISNTNVHAILVLMFELLFLSEEHARNSGESPDRSLYFAWLEHFRTLRCTLVAFPRLVDCIGFPSFQAFEGILDVSMETVDHATSLCFAFLNVCGHPRASSSVCEHLLRKRGQLRAK